jgi:hypothetical protein
MAKNGCSITAFERGKSIDTSMGFTPLEGLVMGTRSGDVDPAVPLYLVKDLGMSPEEVDDLLNKESGLQGLCGRRDMRDIMAVAQQGRADAQTAVEVFVYRIQKYIGAYTAALEGVDAIVFTAGIGENSPSIRAQVLRPFAYLGLRVDDARNEQNHVVFSTKDSRIHALRIPTNEELVIARDTHTLWRGVPWPCEAVTAGPLSRRRAYKENATYARATSGCGPQVASCNSLSARRLRQSTSLDGTPWGPFPGPGPTVSSESPRSRRGYFFDFA